MFKSILVPSKSYVQRASIAFPLFVRYLLWHQLQARFTRYFDNDENILHCLTSQIYNILNICSTYVVIYLPFVPWVSSCLQHIPYIPSDLHFILILPSLTIHYHSTITYSAQGHLSRTADIATSDPRTWDFEKLTTNFAEKQIAEATLPLNRFGDVPRPKDLWSVFPSQRSC